LKTLLIDLIHGIIIGITGLIPGFGMGVCAIILKKYDRVMAILAHPFKDFKNNLKFVVPTVIGIAIGMYTFMGIVEFFLKNYHIQTMYLFLGFALGGLPLVFKQANKKGFKRIYVPTLIITTIIMIIVIIYMNSLKIEGLEISDLSFISLIIYGGIYGFGAIMPSMTTMNILIYLGVLAPMLAGIRAMNFNIILPAAIGYFSVIILTAKFLNYMFENHYGYMYYGILGFAISSLIMLFPGFPRGINVFICYSLFVIGFVSLYNVSKINKKNAEKLG